MSTQNAFSTYHLAHTLDSTLADSKPIPYGDFKDVSIIIPTGSPITSLTFYGCATEDGNYVRIYDLLNAALSMTVAAARAYPLPDELRAFPWLKIVPNADGTADILVKS